MGGQGRVLENVGKMWDLKPNESKDVLLRHLTDQTELVKGKERGST